MLLLDGSQDGNVVRLEGCSHGDVGVSVGLHEPRDPLQ